MDLAEQSSFTNWGDYQSNVGFWWGENRSTQGNLSEQSTEPTKSVHMWNQGQEIEPEPYWWRASALTTATTCSMLLALFCGT